MKELNLQDIDCLELTWERETYEVSEEQMKLRVRTKIFLFFALIFFMGDYPASG
jgi:hypothetical protein